MTRAHQVMAALAVFLMALYIYYFDTKAGGDISRQTAVTDIAIILTTDGYVPSELTVPVGTTVSFGSETGKPHWPASNLHPTHDIYPDFDPRRALAAEESWNFTFTEVGEWNFHDHIRAYYTGTITVVEN